MPTVTLDLWHTLIYLSPDAEERYMLRQLVLAAEVLAGSPPQPNGPGPGSVDLQDAFEREYARAVAQAEEGRTVTSAEQLTRAAKACGRVPHPERYLAALKQEVGETPFQCAPGAVDLLRELHDEGLRVAVISNTVGEPGAFLRPTLQRMGFDPFVDAYVFSDEHPWTKPAPELFRWTLERLGARPADAIHVGDGWSDIEGARRAGFRAGILFTGLQSYGARYRSLFLPRNGERLSSDYRVDSLADVPPLIRSILSHEPNAGADGGSPASRS